MKHWGNSMSRRILVLINIVILFASFVVVLGQPSPANAACGSSTRPFAIFSVPVAKGDSITVTLTSASGSGNNFGGTFLGAPFTSSIGNPAVFSATASSDGTLSVTIGGAVGGGAFFTVTFNCSSNFFNPADGRIDGRPGDRVVVYCNASANPATVDVWGVTNDSKGHRLYKFNFADLVVAGSKGILKKVEPLGSVSASVNANNTFVVRWYGGPAGATGAGDFVKIVTCDFKR